MGMTANRRRWRAATTVGCSCDEVVRVECFLRAHQHCKSLVSNAVNTGAGVRARSAVAQGSIRRGTQIFTISCGVILVMRRAIIIKPVRFCLVRRCPAPNLS